MHRSSDALRLGMLCGVVLLATAGCSENPVSPGILPPVFGAADSVFTNEQLYAAAHTSYAGPVGFYSEQRPETYQTPRYASTFNTAACGSSAGSYIELSTEDIVQARDWAVASLGCNSDSFIVDPGPPLETNRYFEFVAFRPGHTPRLPLRVHRASYLDRSGFDRFRRGAHVGVLMLRPIDAAAVRGVAEYLWSIEPFYGRSDTKVLTSFSRDSEGSILHTIYSVHSGTSIGGLFGPTDYLELLRDDFSVDTESGAIAFSERSLRRIQD